MDSKQPGLTGSSPGPVVSMMDSDQLDLREMLDTLLEGRWLALGVASVVIMLGVAYQWLATPIYRADAVVQVENRTSAALPGLDELSIALGSGFVKSLAEIEIIRSRSVLGRVVSDLVLDIKAAPRRFPLIGAAFARTYKQGEVGSKWPGSGYAWGGERIVVGRLSVPKRLESRRLILEAGESGAYKLYEPEGEILLEGEVGKAAETQLPEDGIIAIFVRELVANSGTQFTVTKLPFDAVVQSLSARLQVNERGRQTGILEVALEGFSRLETMEIVNGVTNSYLRQNVEYQTEQASRMLAFLDQRLPELKEQLDTAETAVREHKSTTGSAIDISAEGQEMLGRVTDVEKQISELELQRSELRQRFTEQHPLFLTSNQKLSQLKQARSSLETQFKSLPATELQFIRLIRDVKVANELYIQLLNKAQELKVAKSGTIGNARVLDLAVLPMRPVRPNKMMVLGLSLVFGVIAGVAVVFLRKSIRRALDNPESVESKLGLPVYATIPHSPKEALVDKVPLPTGVPHLLCRAAPQDSAVESLRSLRTSLQFAQLESRNNIVAIHGPTPNIGKSFVASNLAFLMADIGKRVLLIDADMRKGHLHGLLGTARAPGLADLIAGQCKLTDITHPFDEGRVNFLASGTLPPNPAELLVHGNFMAFLNDVSKHYDFVVIDTPPTLNLADSISIGKLSGANFMVIRGGMSTLQDLQIACSRMQQSDIQVSGIIFNDLSVGTSRYRYGGYYAYRYDQTEKA